MADLLLGFRDVATQDFCHESPSLPLPPRGDNPAARFVEFEKALIARHATATREPSERCQLLRSVLLLRRRTRHSTSCPTIAPWPWQAFLQPPTLVLSAILRWVILDPSHPSIGPGKLAPRRRLRVPHNGR